FVKKDVNQLNETKLVDVRVLDAAIQVVDSEIQALEKQYNTTCVKKKHKEIWRDVEVQVLKRSPWTPGNVIEDIDVVEQATNAF
ncbi:hypothetical protein Tco_1129252, partial [Tanacetum coccineum]